MKKKGRMLRLLLSAVIVLGGASFAQAVITVTTTVDSHAGPWNWNPTTFNNTYGYGVNDHTPPTIIDESDGLSFAAGNTLTIEYISGLVSAYGGTPVMDADGYIGSGYVNGNVGSSGHVFPSYYMDYSVNNIYLMALVGTFANSGGYIVGQPFAIGVGPTDVVIPVGAQQLQLGFNDDVFYDNSGCLQVSVTGEGITTVPVPGAVWLLGSGLIGVLGTRIRRKKQA